MVFLSVIPFSAPIFIFYSTAQFAKDFLVDGEFLHEPHKVLDFYYDTWMEQLTLS